MECTGECLQNLTTDCVSVCLTEVTGASIKCATCYGSLMLCGFLNCQPVCFPADGDDSECQPCLEGFGCKDDFEQCTGLPWNIGDEGPQEICNNQLDDDDNGLIDCLDPECSTNPPCVEIVCGDGFDNDADGLIDCGDPNCEYAAECSLETCANYYLSLAEYGCDCVMGLDCPAINSVEFSACQATCNNNPACKASAIAKLSPEFQETFDSFSSCVTNFCFEMTGSDEWGDCVLDSCADEYSQCFYVGEEACNYFYFECVPYCAGDDACVDDCRNALNSQAFLEALTWDGCRFSLCNQDGDGSMDSDACYYVGSFFACIDQAAGCVTDEWTQGAGSCADVAGCLSKCPSLDDGECVIECLELVGPGNQAPVSTLFTCVINACGTTAAALTPECLGEVYINECAAEYAACDAPCSSDLECNDGDPCTIDTCTTISLQETACTHQWNNFAPCGEEQASCAGTAQTNATTCVEGGWCYQGNCGSVSYHDSGEDPEIARFWRRAGPSNVVGSVDAAYMETSECTLLSGSSLVCPEESATNLVFARFDGAPWAIGGDKAPTKLLPPVGDPLITKDHPISLHLAWNSAVPPGDDLIAPGMTFVLAGSLWAGLFASTGEWNGNPYAFNKFGMNWWEKLNVYDQENPSVVEFRDPAYFLSAVLGGPLTSRLVIPYRKMKKCAGECSQQLADEEWIYDQDEFTLVANCSWTSYGDFTCPLEKVLPWGEPASSGYTVAAAVFANEPVLAINIRPVQDGDGKFDVLTSKLPLFEGDGRYTSRIEILRKSGSPSWTHSVSGVMDCAGTPGCLILETQDLVAPVDDLMETPVALDFDVVRDPVERMIVTGSRGLLVVADFEQLIPIKVPDFAEQPFTTFRGITQFEGEVYVLGSYGSVGSKVPCASSSNWNGDWTCTEETFVLAHAPIDVANEEWSWKIQPILSRKTQAIDDPMCEPEGGLCTYTHSHYEATDLAAGQDGIYVFGSRRGWHSWGEGGGETWGDWQSLLQVYWRKNPAP